MIVSCENCGKEIEVCKSGKSRFCCLNCWYDYRKKHNTKACEYCHKQFNPREQKQRFCSKECVRLYQTTLIGELSPKYNHVSKECEQCGREFSVKKSKENSARFCSRECMIKWYSVYRSTPENKAISSKRIVGIMDNGKMKRTLTKPHLKTTELLKELNIKYECEYSVEFYLVDIFLVDYNLMIEVMGDFWHSNPTTKYKDAKTDQQSKRIGKDKAKHSYIKNQYGIEILYLWEHDIIYNSGICKDLIMQYISNNGVLDDYNSYNYHVVDGGIKVNDDIIRPKFMS